MSIDNGTSIGRAIRAAIDEMKAAMSAGDTHVIVDTMPPVEVAPAEGAATEVTLAAIAAKLPALIGGRLPVEVPASGGGLTNTELRATPVPVSGTFWQSTQPVSATALPLPSGAATATGVAAIATKLGDGTTHVVVDSMPAGVASLTNAELRAAAVPVSLASVPTHGVTGTFWQATQPVSLAASVAVTGTFWQATQPVSGTFWQATQPVSGPLTDAQLRAVPVPVSGTFFQATQPVSGPVTDVQLRATPLPVSGTFFQATQPISAAALPLPSGASTEATLALIKAKTDNLDVALSTRAVTGLTDTQLRASALPVSGTFWQATQPVSGPLTDAQLRAAAVPISGALTDAQIRATALPVSGTFWQATQPVSGPLTDVQLRASSVPVQIKDVGKQRCTITLQATASATVDTLYSVSKNLAGTVTSGTSITVTSGKRLKITGILFSIRAGAAAAAFATLNVRSNAAGATLIGSPSILRVDIGNTAAVIGAADSISVTCEDLEFSGTETIGLSVACQATTNVLSVTLMGYEYTP